MLTEKRPERSLLILRKLMYSTSSQFIFFFSFVRSKYIQVLHKLFWASPFKKPGYRLGFKLHVMRMITGEKIVPPIVKTKVNNSSFAQKHIYLTFKYYGLILSSLNFLVRLDNREDNRKISGKIWHTRTKFYSTVDWNKRPLF